MIPGTFSARQFELQFAQFCPRYAGLTGFDIVRAVAEEAGLLELDTGNRSSRTAFNSDL